jgi:hypothetical protein
MRARAAGVGQGTGQRWAALVHAHGERIMEEREERIKGEGEDTGGDGGWDFSPGRARLWLGFGVVLGP